MLALDNSQVRTFLECQKRYQFRYAWDLSTGMEPWLVTGSAWGSAQDVIWRGGPNTDVLGEAVAAFEQVIEERLPSLSEEGLDDWRITSRHHYHEALADYLNTYQEFICETFDPEKTVCELPFEIEMGGEGGIPPFHLIGRLDKVVWNISEQNWWVGEHKTTAMNLSHAYLNKWPNDNQVRTYGWVGRKLWGAAFGGVLVDCVSISRRGKIALQMIPITFPPLAGGGWEKDMEEIAREVAERWAGRARFVKNTDSCEKFNRMCPYFEACVIGQDPRNGPEGWGLHLEHWDPREHAIRPGSAPVLRLNARK